MFRFLHTEVGLRILKVVDIRGVVLSATSRTANQLGKLTGKGDMARLFHVEEGNLVEHRGEPLTLLFPVHTQAPEGITQGFVAHRHFRGQGLFVEVHQRTRHLEVLREVVLPVQAQHRLTLHAVFRVRLQTHADVRPGIDDTLVQDGHLTCRVVYGIVGALRQLHATRRYLHRPLWYIVGTQRDHVGRGALILTGEYVFVFFGYQFRHRLGRVIEFGEDVFTGLRLWEATIHKLPSQIAAKGLCRGQEHASVAHGIVFHIVEVTVGVELLVIVQAVTAQQLQQRAVLHPLVGDIGQIHTCRITLILDVETELRLLDRRGEVVHVLHHQLPVAL